MQDRVAELESERQLEALRQAKKDSKRKKLATVGKGNFSNYRNKDY